MATGWIRAGGGQQAGPGKPGAWSKDLSHDVTLLNGVFHQVGGFLQVQFSHNVGAVMLHRPAADKEQFADFLAGFSFGDELDDLPLPNGKRLPRRHPGLVPGLEFVHDNIGHLGGQQG